MPEVYRYNPEQLIDHCRSLRDVDPGRRAISLQSTRARSICSAALTSGIDCSRGRSPQESLAGDDDHRGRCSRSVHFART